MLRAPGLAGDDDATGHMGDAHGRFRLVDMLATRAGRTVDVGLQVGRIDLDVDVVVDLGRDEDRGETRVPAVVRIKR